MLPSYLNDPHQPLEKFCPRISSRVINVCRRNGINTLGELIEYYNENQNFNNLERSGVETHYELSTFIEKHFSIDEDKSVANLLKSNPSIEELVLKGFINVRACNALKDVKFEALQNIYTYFKRNKHFLDIKGIGEKTNKELCYLGKQLSQCKLEIPEDISYRNKHPIIEEWEDSDNNKKCILNYHFIKSIQKLSANAQNGMQRVLNIAEEYNKSNYKLERFIDYSHEINFQFEEIDNISKKTSKELNELIEGLVEYARNSKLPVDQKLEYQIALMKIELYLSDINGISIGNVPQLLSGYEKKYFDGNFPFVKVLNQIVDETSFFNYREKLILQGRMGYFHDKETYTLKDIGEKTGISRERVRQIQTGGKVDKKLFNLIYILLVYIRIDKILNREYFKNFDKPIPVGYLNQSEGVKMSEKFYSLIRDIHWLNFSNPPNNVVKPNIIDGFLNNWQPNLNEKC